MKKVTKAVIPAAGLGTRFLPATIAQPKEMLPIVDKPVIQFVVEEAVKAGATDILIITGRSKRAIEDHFDPSFELEFALEKKKSEFLKTLKYISSLANIHFIRQQRQLGLGHAIFHAKSFIGDESFSVLLGDTVIYSPNKNHNLKKMVQIHEKSGKSVVAGVEVSEEKIPRFGIIDPGKEIEDRTFIARDLVEKPAIKDAPSNLAIAARYVFDSSIFDLIEKTKPGKGGEIQITDSMKFLCKKNKMLAYKIFGRRYDIGNKVDFVKTNIDFALRNPDTKDEIKSYIEETVSKGII